MRRSLFPIIIVILAILLLSIPTTLPNTTYIDYTKPNLQSVITEIEAYADSDLKKIVFAALWVNENIEYKTIDGDICMAETASDIVEKGEGNCVSSTKVVASLLTGMNIPVVILEGCVFTSSYEQYRALKIPKDPLSKSRTLPVKTDEGQLHSWLRAYDGKSWYTVETTTGEVFPSSFEDLYGYNKYGGYVSPADNERLCLLTNEEYVNFCWGAENG